MSVLTERLNGDLPIRSAESAAQAIPERGTVVVSGFGSVGYPKEVPLALADDDDRDLSLTVVSGGSLGDEIDVEMVRSNAIVRRFPYQSRAAIRDAINSGSVEFQDYHVSEMADRVQYGRIVDPDIAVIEAVAVGEDWLIPSTSIGQTPAYVASAPRLIVEVNDAQPLGLQTLHDVYRRDPPPHRDPIPLSDASDRIGDNRIRFDPSKLVAVVRGNRRDAPYKFREPTEDDLAIADNFGKFVSQEVTDSPLFDEKVHLQFGVGSLGNALMAVLESVDVGDRELTYFGEVIQDGLLDMIEDGHLATASASSLALSTDGQDKLFSNLDRYEDSIVLRPSDVSNSPSLINRLGVIAVNSGLEVDLYGNVNSTHLHGTHIVNGIGGSGDFNRNAAISIMALPSYASDGSISRVVPSVTHVDHTEHDIDVVVTEQGVADLRGLCPRERAKAIIQQCAHPDFEKRLQEYLDDVSKNSGHIQHDFTTAFDQL